MLNVRNTEVLHTKLPLIIDEDFGRNRKIDTQISLHRNVHLDISILDH